MDFVRATYLTGAVVDAVATLGLALPARSRLRRLIYPAIRANQIDFVEGSRSALPLMAGWTALLLWGWRKPAERRAILALTAVPVVAGFVAGEALDIRRGYADRRRSLPTFVLQAVLAWLFAAGYRRVASGSPE